MVNAGKVCYKLHVPSYREYKNRDLKPEPEPGTCNLKPETWNSKSGIGSQ
jgi:hypothetical protein